jgi:hypothetical protein
MYAPSALHILALDVGLLAASTQPIHLSLSSRRKSKASGIGEQAKQATHLR